MELLNSSFLPSIAPAVQSSSPSSGVSLLKFKRKNNMDKQLTRPVASPGHRHSVGYRAQYRKGCDGVFRSEDPRMKPLKIRLKTFQEKLDLFNRFIWSEIIVHKMWSTISVSLLAVHKLSDITPSFLAVLCQAIVAVALMNIYIIVLNQITDIEIDRVNKPHRPLITGEYSIKTAVVIVISSAIMSFLIGWMVGSIPLFCSLLAGFALGTVYSVNLPLLRWKRNSFAAAFCMLFGHVVWPLGNYLNIQTFVLGKPVSYSKALVSIISFLSLITIAQSQIKDIPDIEGDKLEGIHTIAFKFGAHKVFWICIGLIEFAYFVVILIGLKASYNWNKLIIVPSHLLLVSMVWNHAKSINLENKAAIQSFYVFLRKLVSVEYFLIHFMR